MQFRALQQPRAPFQSLSGPSQPRGPHRRGHDLTMTAGGPLNRPNAPPVRQTSGGQSTSRAYVKHSSGKRINTDVLVTEAIRAEYPELHLTVTPRYSANLLEWAQAGHAELTSIDEEKERLRWRSYFRPPNRLGGTEGYLSDKIVFGKFLIKWKDRDYIVYIADARDGTDYFGREENQYILSPSIIHTNQVLLECGVWTSELHDEIWVFDQGFWEKSSELYESIRNASWDDVILAKSQKDAMIHDVDNFFNSQDTFDRLNVPWKRGGQSLGNNHLMGNPSRLGQRSNVSMNCMLTLG